MKVKPFLKYLALAVVILILFAGGYFGLSWYRSLKNPVLPVYNAIPEQTALFAEFTDPAAMIHNLADHSLFWSDLLSIESVKSFQNHFIKLDSLVNLDSQISGAFRSRRSVTCICNTDSSAGVLFLCELPSTGYEPAIKNFIIRTNGEKSVVMQKKSGKGTISLVNIAGIRNFFNYSVYKGLFIGSFQESLVKQAIARLESEVPVDTDDNFRKLQITAGKNVDANVYINYPEFAKLSTEILNPSVHKTFGRLGIFADWTGLDLIVKPDEIFMNGYSVCDRSKNQWLSLLEQEPQPVLIPEILPGGISLLVHLGLGSYDSYLSTLRKLRKAGNKDEDYDKKEKAIKKNLGIDISDEFSSWIGHELALATTALPGTSDGTTYIVIQTKDVAKAQESLQRLSLKAIAGKPETLFLQKYEDYEIRKLELKGLFPLLFGEWLDDAFCPYFTSIRDYIVFADSPEAITKLLAGFYEQKTLSENSSFRNYATNISDKSNLFVYCNLNKTLPGISNLFSEPLSEGFMNNSAAFRNFEGISIQLSHVGDMFYTSLFMKYNPSEAEEIPSGWTVELEGNVYGSPYFFRNDQSGKMNVVVFDDQSNMYLLDHHGRVVWKTPLTELPLSGVFRLENDENASGQFLFNTTNYIYIIDGSGNYVNSFPVKLTPAATNGLLVTDYENNRNYRIILALSDNRIQNFDFNLVPVTGWNKIAASSRVTEPVQYLQIGDKDYLLVTDENGAVSITDRTGKSKINVKKGFQKARNSIFYENETNDKGLILTTDPAGKLVYIKENGKTDRTDFGTFSKEHFFLYEDFSQDGSIDFIFADQNKLIIFDRFKKQIFAFGFPETITIKPIFINSARNLFTLGIVSVAENKIYLFNKDGQVFIENNFSGNTPFVTGSLNADGKINLVTGNGNKVINYLLE